MAMLDLPRDLLENIFSRLDEEFLRQFRCTCKLFNALFKDRGFLQQRFHKAAREVLVMMNSRLFILDVDIDGRQSYTVIKFSRLQYNDQYRNDVDRDQFDISNISHCDGLLLLHTTFDNMLIVWNPCSGQTMHLYPNNQYTGGIFALGYHSKLCDSYKILSINEKSDSVELEMFDLYSDSCSWRALDDVTIGCNIQSRGVSLRGNAYWIASEVIKDSLLLLSFDFTTERFERMDLCFQRVGYEILALSVVSEEQLSVLQQSLETSMVEIWVTANDKSLDQTKILSWSKLLAVDLYTYYYDHRFTYDVSFFIDKESKVVVCWDKEQVYIFGEDHHYGHINVLGGSGCEPLFPAVMFQGWFKFKLPVVTIRSYFKFRR
ncbi:putative F-box protein At3g17500 [Capsella rubella]|nr:putative F-box protein At3g17500 [Capsella rubella]